MRQRGIALAILMVCGWGMVSSAEAAGIFRFMENKNYNIYNYGKRMPFHTFNRQYYETRYPFNQYHIQQAHSFNGYPEYNR